MPEYIEREVLLKVRPFRCIGGPLGDYTEGFLDCAEEARNAIRRVPAADVEPVRHGRWIWTETGPEEYEQYWICSECGEQNYYEAKFCPNCGAKMDIKNLISYR